MKKILSKEDLKQRVEEMGKEVTKKYKEKDMIKFVVPLKGSFIFAADLIREVKIDNVEIDFINMRSYDGVKSTGSVMINGDIDVSGYNVIIVEDIIDSGLSITSLCCKMLELNAKSILVISLLYNDKSNFRPDLFGFKHTGNFVVGYGLDYNQTYRNLDGIYEL